MDDKYTIAELQDYYYGKWLDDKAKIKYSSSKTDRKSGCRLLRELNSLLK